MYTLSYFVVVYGSDLGPTLTSHVSTIIDLVHILSNSINSFINTCVYCTIYCLYYSEGYIPGRTEQGGILLCLGIIDILRKYKLKRNLQHGLKSVDDVSNE